MYTYEGWISWDSSLHVKKGIIPYPGHRDLKENVEGGREVKKKKPVPRLDIASDRARNAPCWSPDRNRIRWNKPRPRPVSIRVRPELWFVIDAPKRASGFTYTMRATPHGWRILHRPCITFRHDQLSILYVELEGRSPFHAHRCATWLGKETAYPDRKRRRSIHRVLRIAEAEERLKMASERGSWYVIKGPNWQPLDRNKRRSLQSLRFEDGTQTYFWNTGEKKVWHTYKRKPFASAHSQPCVRWRNHGIRSAFSFS